MQPTIKLTDTMLNKHIIDCNKSIREFIYKHFGIKYKDDLEHLKNNTYTIYNSEGVNKSYTLPCDIDFLNHYEVTPSHVKFYMTKRGDKRLSIKLIKKLAKVGDIINFNVTHGVGDSKGITSLYLTIQR
tara:strand:+ start:222 stop:608 length:387 start_codon:yes stop_codon:yes gene_type:complete